MWTYTIDLLGGNGPPITVTATRQHIGEGALHLFTRSGPGTNEVHAGSWPLTSIRSWKRVER